jgi:hypothetical protein
MPVSQDVIVLRRERCVMPTYAAELQTQTKALNGELDEVFPGWYPKFRPQLEET